VYIVEDVNGIVFAMKVINLVPITSPDYDEVVRKVQQEFATGKKLGSESPFLVKMEKFIIEGDYCLLIMEFCSGGDLGELLKSKKKFSPNVFFFYLFNKSI
jgi:serine/threonine protein kinase